MKKTDLVLVLLALMALIWTSCHKDKELDGKDPIVSNEEITVSGTQARFSWCVDFSGQFQTGVEVSQNENMTDVRRVEALKQEEKYMAVVNDLSMGRKYYYRIVVWNKFINYEEQTKSFNTSQNYTVTPICLPEEGGTATGGGSYAAGDTCTLVATANVGYVFVNWTENDIPIDTNSVYSFVVTSDRELVANFSEEGTVLYTVITKAEPEVGGIVTGEGIYEEGREIELKAMANMGYTFIQWSDGSTDNPRTVTVTADVTYTAYFNHEEYEIKVECQPENGGMAMGGGMFHYGDTIALSAMPNADFNFEGWSDGSTDNPHEVVIIGPATYKAIFSEAGEVYYHVTTHVYPDGAGTVTGGGPHPEGSQIQLSANANTEAGYLFEKWDDGDTHNPRIITVNADMEFTAIFKKMVYTVTVQANIGGTAHIGDMTGTIEATFEHSESCMVHAIAETGYSFVNWTENGTEASTEENYSFEVTGNRILVANFQQQYQTFNVNGVFFAMKRVQGGTFWMGAQSTNPIEQNYVGEAYDNESPVHSVTLSSYYIGVTEVTQELWQAVMGSNPSFFSHIDHPVEQVSWNVIVNQFLPALNAATGQNFRLPTEAEWEFAARGGNQGHGYKYAGSNSIGDVAWYSDNSFMHSSVAQKLPNELGLYDMSGNVWEWCSDWYGNYSSGSQTNPQGPSSGYGSTRVLRGGSCSDSAGNCRVSFRNGRGPVGAYTDSGFRLALPQ